MVHEHVTAPSSILRCRWPYYVRSSMRNAGDRADTDSGFGEDHGVLGESLESTGWLFGIGTSH